jgi:hypothetical protein
LVEGQVTADRDRADGMECVYELPAVTASSPMDAAIALRAAIEEMVRLALDNPPEHWLRLASDDHDDQSRPAS